MISARNFCRAAILTAALLPAGAAAARSAPAAEPATAAAPAAEAVRRARETLAAAAAAYRRAPALEDRITYVVKSAGAVQPPKTIEVRLGAGRDVAVSDPLFAAVALDGTLYVTKLDAPGKYVARPYAGDFARTLDSIVGEQGELFEPIQVAMRLGKDHEGWLNALRFKLLGPLAIAGYEEKIDAGGQAVEAVRFTAANGELEADFDRATHFLSRISLRSRPPGAPPDIAIEVSATLAPEVLASPRGLVTFDSTGALAVADLTSLDAQRLATGGPAPAFELEKVAGGRVALSALRGSVVVIDFWATWCAPCWQTLKETQRLADWASGSGLPIAVLAIDTMEQFPTANEKRTRAAAFLKSQSLTLPSLLDLSDEVFHRFGAPGLPSMVVIAPDGTIFKIHQGLFPAMLATLQAEVRQAAAPR